MTDIARANAPASALPTANLQLPGLTEDDDREIAGILAGDIADSTRTRYVAAWRDLTCWAGARGLTQLPMPPRVVVAYLKDMAKAGRSVATIRVHRAAIGYLHRHRGLQDTTATPVVRAALRSMARQHSKRQRQATPLTSEGLAAIRATAATPRRGRGRGGPPETPAQAQHRAVVDVALLAVMRDGLLRRGEAAALLWGHLELWADGSARLLVERSKGDQEGQGAVLYIGTAAVKALLAIRPADAVIPADTSIFGLSASQIGRRVKAAARAAGLGEGFTGHSGRVGMAQDLSAAGVELPALMTAGRWKRAETPARYTESQAAGRGAVARYYQQRGG